MPEPTASTATPTPRGPVARSPITPAAPVTTLAGWEVSARRSNAALLLTDLTPLAKVQVRAAPEGPMSRALDLTTGRAGRGTTLDRALTNGASPAGTNALVAHSGPGEWLVLSPPGTAADMTARLERVAAAARSARAAGTTGTTGSGGSADPELVTVTDLTHGRALIRVTGERAPELLAKLCTIDLSDTVTPNGAAFRTAVARLATDVIRDDLQDGSRNGFHEPVGEGTGEGTGEGVDEGVREQRPDRDREVVREDRHKWVRSYLLHCERSSGQYLFEVLLDAGADLGIDTSGFTAPGI